MSRQPPAAAPGAAEDSSIRPAGVDADPAPRVPVAKVIPLTRTRAVKGAFDYRLPAETAEIGIGSILRVPFGGRSAFGVVVGMAATSALAPDRLAEPDEVLASTVPPDLVALAGWMATEYCSTTARALGLVLPPGITEGMRPRRSLVAELTPTGLRRTLGPHRPAHRRPARPA